MMISATVHLDSRKLDRVPAFLRSEVTKIVATNVKRAGLEVRASLIRPKSGRMYGGRISSAPYEAPAIRSGRLLRSIRTKMITPTSGLISSNAKYAKFLEQGAPLHRGPIKPRPFIGPAMWRAQMRIRADVAGLSRRLGKI
jgi:hypothetical protein